MASFRSPRWTTTCRLAALLLLAGLSACAKDPLRPYPSPPSVVFPAIDFYPVWTRDGNSIAYYRTITSADGPPGVYLISKWGGPPRLIAPTLFKEFNFSPDDRQLVGVGPNQQISVLDITTGGVRQLLYTNRLVQEPDWSPDGQRIVYARGRDFFSEPPDSGGLHIFDLRTGVNQPIVHNGSVVAGFEPRWLPTGHIIFVGDDGSGRERLGVVEPEGTNLRFVYTSSGDSFYSLHSYNRPNRATSGILFTDNDLPPNGGTYFVHPDGSGLERLPPLWAPLLTSIHEAFSPDGEEVAYHGIEPVDSLDVLFVRRVGDPSGATARQLTRYAPPAAAGQIPQLSALGHLAELKFVRPHHHEVRHDPPLAALARSRGLVAANRYR
jgi:dipeptidyl aminopeptidase/acylaminoacyl peptidase